MPVQLSEKNSVDGGPYHGPEHALPQIIQVNISVRLDPVFHDCSQV